MSRGHGLATSVFKGTLTGWQLASFFRRCVSGPTEAWNIQVVTCSASIKACEEGGLLGCSAYLEFPPQLGAKSVKQDVPNSQLSPSLQTFMSASSPCGDLADTATTPRWLEALHSLGELAGYRCVGSKKSTMRGFLFHSFRRF